MYIDRFTRSREHCWLCRFEPISPTDDEDGDFQPRPSPPRASVLNMRLLNSYIFQATGTTSLRHISLEMHSRKSSCAKGFFFNNSRSAWDSLLPIFSPSFATFPSFFPPYMRLLTCFGWISYDITELLPLESINRSGFSRLNKFIPAITYSCSYVMT